MSILSNLRDLKKADVQTAKTPMTDDYAKSLKAKLMADNRMNVYPNKFDQAVPFRVAVRKGSEYTTHGYFTSADVASAVGTIVSKATFGAEAKSGEYDEQLVEKHPEFLAWLSDSRNAGVIALAA